MFPLVHRQIQQMRLAEQVFHSHFPFFLLPDTKYKLQMIQRQPILCYTYMLHFNNLFQNKVSITIYSYIIDKTGILYFKQFFGL